MKRGGSGIRCAVRSFYLRVEHPTAEREAEIVALAGTRKLRRCAAISMADWFKGELKTHHCVMPALGIGCDPLIVKAEKEQFLDWLSWGVESDAIRFPVETGSVRWPLLSRKDIFQQVN